MRERRRGWALRTVACVLGLMTVAPLLAWLWGLGSFAAWYRIVAPAVILGLALIGRLSSRRPSLTNLRAALVSGVFGGLLGSIGYDLFRVPFVVAGGVQLFAPIQSFGILALNAGSSSPATDWAGWSDHFFNGIGFAIAYAMVALGRHWAWGILWGCTLETLTLITPYAREYSIAGHWDLIAIALSAHLVYGSLLGLVVQRGRSFTANADHVTRMAAPAAIVGLLMVLTLSLRPDRTATDERSTADRGAGVGIVISAGTFVPQWIRVAPGTCIAVSNHDGTPHQISGGPMIAADARGRLCAAQTGVTRVRVDSRPFSGGYVLVDASDR